MFNKSGIFNRNDPLPTRGPTAESRGIPTLENSRSAAAKNGSTSATSSSGSAASTAATPPVATPAEPTKLPREPDAASGESLGARLIVGPEVKLRGAEILDCDTLVVEGRVEATMDSRVIRIAENGSFSGKVSIDIAEIHGSFEGELTARLQLIIHSTGRVSGTIRYGKLVADEGCQLCGDINLLDSTSKPKGKVEPLVGFNTAAG
jgi:cytoskeletal protein CcmA (bactofilin family)